MSLIGFVLSLCHDALGRVRHRQRRPPAHLDRLRRHARRRRLPLRRHGLPLHPDRASTVATPEGASSTPSPAPTSPSLGVAMLFAALMAFRTLGGQYSAKDREGVVAAAVFWYVRSPCTRSSGTRSWSPSEAGRWSPPDRSCSSAPPSSPSSRPWVYGWGTGGGLTGVIFLGLKGGVGELAGYTSSSASSASSLGLGVATSILRDADPEAPGRRRPARVAARRSPPPPGVGYWPVLGGRRGRRRRRRARRVAGACS